MPWEIVGLCIAWIARSRMYLLPGLLRLGIAHLNRETELVQAKMWLLSDRAQLQLRDNHVVELWICGATKVTRPRQALVPTTRWYRRPPCHAGAVAE